MTFKYFASFYNKNGKPSNSHSIPTDGMLLFSQK